MRCLLLSINPEYVERILSHEKRFEFRKNRCKDDVDRLIIYCTNPVKKVVGEARIVRVIVDTPEAVWSETEHASGITREFFDSYYSGRDLAVAYELSDVIEYDEPKELSDYGVSWPPQSYCYVDV